MIRNKSVSAYAASIALPDFGKAPGDGFSGAASWLVAVAVGAVARFFGAIVSIAESFHRAHQINRTYAELSVLDDCTLSDIGLSRCELGAVAIHCVDNPGAEYRKCAS